MIACLAKMPYLRPVLVYLVDEFLNKVNFGFGNNHQMATLTKALFQIFFHSTHLCEGCLLVCNDHDSYTISDSYVIDFVVLGHLNVSSTAHPVTSFCCGRSRAQMASLLPSNDHNIFIALEKSALSYALWLYDHGFIKTMFLVCYISSMIHHDHQCFLKVQQWFCIMFGIILTTCLPYSVV